jgi:hypothetical protein
MLRSTGKQALLAGGLALALLGGGGIASGAIPLDGSGIQPLNQWSGPIDVEANPIRQGHSHACPNHLPCEPTDVPVASPAK